MTSFVLDLFRMVFRRKKSIPKIVRPMQKIVRDLDLYADQQAKAQAKHEVAATQAQALAAAAREEQNAAARLAGNYKGLIGVAAE